MSIEEFITVKIGQEYYQGYIDCKIIDDNEIHTILDWKTSSIYKGEKERNMGSLSYKMYVWFYCYVPIKKALRFPKRAISAIRRRVFRKNKS